MAPRPVTPLPRRSSVGGGAMMIWREEPPQQSESEERRLTTPRNGDSHREECVRTEDCRTDCGVVE